MNIRLDWQPSGWHAMFHLAQQKGWFARYGLDVSLEDGNGSVSTVQIVGNGQFDAGFAALAPMMIARSRGVPVRAIGSMVRQNDIGVMVPESAHITEIAQLRGKKLVYTPGSLETPFLDRFLAAGGLTRNDVELLSVDGTAKVGMYVNNRADGLFSSIPFAVPSVRAQRPASAIRFADHGLEFPSFGLFATDRAIHDKADALRRLASVVAGTWAYVMDGHEDEGVQAIIAARPQARLQPAVLRGQIELLRNYLTTDATRDKPMGVMADADWNRAVAVLSDAKLLEKPEAGSTYFTNELLDPAIIAAVAKGTPGGTP